MKGVVLSSISPWANVGMFDSKFDGNFWLSNNVNFQLEGSLIFPTDSDINMSDILAKYGSILKWKNDLFLHETTLFCRTIIFLFLFHSETALFYTNISFRRLFNLRSLVCYYLWATGPTLIRFFELARLRGVSQRWQRRSQEKHSCTTSNTSQSEGGHL